MCESADQVEKLAKQMLGHTLVTKQTGAEGRVVSTVLISERHKVLREMYFAIMFDRTAGGPVMIASPKGGVNIEDVAKDTPQFIFKEVIDPVHGPESAQIARLAAGLMQGAHENTVIESLLRQEIQLYWNMFDRTDATMLEINPLAEVDDERILALDAKINFDDNAAFRQKDIHALRDTSQEDGREVRAAKFDLNYIGLDGNIGCLVNGAGLAMATMDIIKHSGGSPANFLDVGGGATRDQVREAIKILNDDPHVEAILVNIFGGIMRCDTISDGLVAAAEEVGLAKPLVVRLEGTNVDEGLRILAKAKLGVEVRTAKHLDEAAKFAVAAAARAVKEHSHAKQQHNKRSH
jgi:succinyl-CoA synthetase beta subunit